MSQDLKPLLDRAQQGGAFTLNELRDYASPRVSQERALELTIRVHQSIQDLTPAERICALVCALMMELV